MNIPVFKKKKIAIAILVTAPLFDAQAALIDLKLSAEASASIEDISPIVATFGPVEEDVFAYAEANGIYSYENAKIDDEGYGDNGEGTFTDSLSPGSSSWSSAYIRGDMNGGFGGNVYGAGDKYASSATFLQSYSVTNDESTDQDFDFTFKIENGGISSQCGPFSEEIDCQNSSSSYQAEILLNGSQIFYSAAALTFSDLDNLFTFNDTSAPGNTLGIYSSGASFYQWDTQSFNIDLGTFISNETFTLDYRVTLNTSGMNAYSSAQFGDPNGFGQSSSSFTNTAATPTTSVPEPGSLGIIAAGLGLLGLNRRRKNKAHH